MPKLSRLQNRLQVLAGMLTHCALTMILGGCADSLLLHPSTNPIAVEGAVAHHVPVANKTLELWEQRSSNLKSENSEVFVLEFCGNATRAEWIINFAARRWRQVSAEIWAVNTPGFGGSTGPARLSAITAAALAAYDDIALRAVGRKIFVEGNSIGTTAALYVAAHRPVAGLILQNPPPLRRLIIENYGWWNLWLIAMPVALQIPSELNSLTNARLDHAPALFLLADHDELVPPPYHQLVVDAYSGPKRVIDLIGAKHNDLPSEAEEEQVQAGIAWLVAGEK
jgi:hypothetical protein